MTYQEVINYLAEMPPFIPVKTPDGRPLFDLSAVRELAGRLGNPQNKLKCVHIAGTNGKGSVADFLSEIMKESGYKTGTFTSPYLKDIREQTKINGEIISKDDFADIFTEVIDVVKLMTADGLSCPSEFEMDVVASFIYFLRNDCDVCIIEVGLGGEYDATNIIYKPHLCIFTSISKDHTAVLGEDTESIAKIKAGIIKHGCDVLCAPQEKKVYQVLKEKSKKSQSTFIMTNEPYELKADVSGISFSMSIDKIKYSFETRVTGLFQAENASLAIDAALILRNKDYREVNIFRIKAALLKVRRPKRFEIINTNPVVIADGAHNLGGATVLLESLKEIFFENFDKGRGFIFINGVLADKNYKDMIELFVKHAFIVYTITPDNVRALPARELADAYKSMGAEAVAVESLPKALHKARNAALSNGKPIIIFGSLYMYKDII